MIVDFAQRDTPSEFDTDLCIIGAGAAGIAIANEFHGSTFKILLVESGGLDFDASVQSLYDVENVGIARQPMILQRLRYFGGTTNHWDGRCAPLDPIDFEKREWIPHSGWPISRNELDPFYERAHSVCDLKSSIQNESVASLCHIPSLPTDPDKLVVHTWQFSAPTRFGPKYRPVMEASKSVMILLNANATSIVTNDADSHVEQIRISALGGKAGRIRARIFVLACGGIENPRLLLASDEKRPNGAGNANGLVGRFFMEHLRTKYVAAPLGDDYRFRATFNDCYGPEGDFLAGMRLADNLQRAQRIGNGAVMSYTEGGENSSTNSAFRIIKSLIHGKLPEHFGADVLNTLGDLNSLIINLRRSILMPGSETIEKSLVTLVCESEQVPNPNSQITLSEQRDGLGQRKAKVNWQLAEEDLHTTQVFIKTLGEQLAAHFNTRIRIPEWLSSPYENWTAQFRDVSHHMGTTRMSATAKEGVVDKNCRMHALDNLYVAGSSVFTTSGQVNPTLTIVSLALRLADHLKHQLKEGA